jgi:hypothetical protein
MNSRDEFMESIHGIMDANFHLHHLLFEGFIALGVFEREHLVRGLRRAALDAETMTARLLLEACAAGLENDGTSPEELRSGFQVIEGGPDAS